MKDAIYNVIYKSTKMDPYLLGGHIGAFTTIVYLAVDYLLSRIIGSNPIPYYSAILVLSHANTGWDFFFGIQADLVAGTFVGFFSIFICERTNYKNLILKGIVAGGVLWILHISLLPKFWDHKLLSLMTHATVYQSFFTHVFWGACYGAILGRFIKTTAAPNDPKSG